MNKYKMTTACLFCHGDGCKFCGDVNPDWFQGGTDVQKGNVSNGRHPFGYPLSPIFDESKTCGTCERLHEARYHGQKHYKCTLNGNRHSKETDVRLKWAACIHWQVDEEKAY